MCPAWQGMSRPGGIDLAGGHGGDIFLERHRHIAGGLGRAAQVHRDGLGHHHLGEHPPPGAVSCRGGPAAAPPGKQRVGRDGHIVFRRDPGGSHGGVGGQKRKPGHGFLPVKHLHPADPHRLPAFFFGHQIIHGVRPHHRIVLLQAVRAVGCSQPRLYGGAVLIGFQAGDGHPGLVQHGHPHPRQRRGLFGQGRRDPNTASRHR